MKHLIDIKSLTQNDILGFLNQTKQFLKDEKLITDVDPILKNKTIINLFFEDSTRTLCSFEVAEKKLGADVINFNAKRSSLNKGETLHDTVLNLAAFGADCFVVRHSEDHSALKIAQLLNDEVHIINGGDGTHAHPTQALLDVFTIQQHKPDFENLSIAVIGDIKHSRVAHSLTTALITLGAKDIRVAGPSELLPSEYETKIVDTFEEAIKGVDVIYMLRIQRERLEENCQIDTLEYFQKWGLTENKLKLAKPNAIVLHPGPINREVEIASAVADGPQSVIFEQARNGVAIRMAVLAHLLKNT